jgi:hypothetical protein
MNYIGTVFGKTIFKLLTKFVIIELEKIALPD